MAKETAVEWLWKCMPTELLEQEYIKAVFNQAKAMEKEQMTDFYVKGCEDTYGVDEGDSTSDRTDAIRLYEKTFK